jgi:hypothetical protein
LETAPFWLEEKMPAEGKDEKNMEEHEIKWLIAAGTLLVLHCPQSQLPECVTEIGEFNASRKFEEQEVFNLEKKFNLPNQN